MKKFFVFLTALTLTFSLDAQTLDGYWKGSLDVMGNALELCFDVTSSGGGSYSATMDVPQQGAKDIRVDEFTFDGVNVYLDIKALGASFKGLFVMDMISGNFSQNGLSLPLVLKKGERQELVRPQNPQPPFPYTEEEVLFENAADGIRLAGTLTVPEGGKAQKAVVLVTGSGSQNRDEELMGHRPFAVIADYLTRRGIAVLRYDDRGMGGSEAGPAGATSLDLSRDAAAAVDYLRGRFGTVGVAGHSEGGLIAFLLGAEGKLDFIVSLAGTTVSGAEVLDAQRRAVYAASGLPQESIEANASLFRSLDEVISRHGTPDEAMEEVEAALSMLPAEQKDEIVKQLLDPWMFWFNKFDPTGAILAIRCPVLALNGDKDVQVIASQNIGRLENLKKEHGSLNVRTVVLPGLNHLFQHCGTGLPDEYGTIEETFSEDALKLISEFILGL